jgi:hypothetical protein
MEIDKALEGFDFAGNGLTEGLGGGSQSNVLESIPLC